MKKNKKDCNLASIDQYNSKNEVVLYLKKKLNRINLPPEANKIIRICES